MILLAVYGLQLVGTFLQNVLIVAAFCQIPKDLWFRLTRFVVGKTDCVVSEVTVEVWARSSTGEALSQGSGLNGLPSLSMFHHRRVGETPHTQWGIS
jgi:hypothetical protein